MVRRGSLRIEEVKLSFVFDVSRQLQKSYKTMLVFKGNKIYNKTNSTRSCARVMNNEWPKKHCLV